MVSYKYKAKKNFVKKFGKISVDFNFLYSKFLNINIFHLKNKSYTTKQNKIQYDDYYDESKNNLLTISPCKILNYSSRK